MALYNLRTDPSGYRITKFTDDLEVESSYLMALGDDPSGYLCGCPASARPSCRHRDMIHTFLARPDTIDSNWMLDFNPGTPSAWRQYVGEFAFDGGENETPPTSAEPLPEPTEDLLARERVSGGYIPFASDNPVSALTPMKRRI